MRTKKFTKKAFNKALKNDNITEVWRLCALNLGRRPEKKEVYNLIKSYASTCRGAKKAYLFAYASTNMRKREIEDLEQCSKKGTFKHYNDAYYRTEALIMLRQLLTEPISAYSKAPIMGYTRLYFASPWYGHKDYNKHRTVTIKGNEEFCKKIMDISQKFLAKKGGNIKNANEEE